MTRPASQIERQVTDQLPTDPALEWRQRRVCLSLNHLITNDRSGRDPEVARQAGFRVKPPLQWQVSSEANRPVVAGSTYRKLLLDSGQWKIQSLANVSLLA